MASKHGLKILSIVLLGVATFVITRYGVVASQRRATERAGVTEADAGESLPRLARNQVAVSSNLYISGMNQVLISELIPVAGGIHVGATAEVGKFKRDRQFVWKLAIYSGTTHTRVWDDRYDHQLGLVPRGTVSRPTFREELALPGGSYAVSVEIYEVPSGGLGDLDNQDVARAHLIAADFKEISIP